MAFQLKSSFLTRVQRIFTNFPCQPGVLKPVVQPQVALKMFHLLNLFILIISVQILTVALIFMFYFLQTEMSMFWPDTADKMIAEKLFRESDLGPFISPDAQIVSCLKS